MHARIELALQQCINPPMPFDAQLAFEFSGHRDHLEMALAARRYVVIVAFVVHLEMIEFDPVGEKLFDTFCSVHPGYLSCL